MPFRFLADNKVVIAAAIRAATSGKGVSTFPPAPKIILCAVLASVLTGCGDAEVATQEPVIRPAKLIDVELGSNEQRVSFPAIIDASATADLAFEVGGTVQEILVREGEEVAQDQVIARLDQRTYTNDLAAAQSQLDNAQAEFARAERLVEQNAIARNVFEQRRSQRDVARTALDNAQKAFESTELKAPFAGRIATIDVDAFESVSPGTPAAVVQSVGAAEAVVQVPSSMVANSGNIEPIDTWVTLDAAPDERFAALFLSAAARADTSTQTFEVKFGFTPPDRLSILPGMTGTVQGTYQVAGAEDEARQIVIPLSAIGADGDARFAWLVDTDTMTVTRRELALGAGIGELITVLDGLSDGDTIVGAGMSYLHEGMQIRAYEQ